MKDGFFDAGTKANAQGVIEDWACHEDLTIVRLWIPNTITSIGSNAFSGCANLSEVTFEEGGDLSLSIGLMSFACCPELSAIVLPARTASIGMGCFRDCTMLEEIEIGAGFNSLHVGNHTFDNCAEQVMLEETLQRECERRITLQTVASIKTICKHAVSFNTVLQGLRLHMPNGVVDTATISQGLIRAYDMMQVDPDFPFAKYVLSYGSACDHFATISDWTVASEEELRKVMVGSYIQNVAKLRWGEVNDEEFQSADKTVLRSLCSSIYGLSGDICENSVVAELEERYVAQFPVRRSAAFYRMVAAIKPALVVQVPAIAKLAPVYAWLTGSEIEEAYNSGWYKLSCAVRAKLQELLPGKSYYQVGVFSWFLAESFRDDLGTRKDAIRRKGKVLNTLRDAGLL